MKRLALAVLLVMQATVASAQAVPVSDPVSPVGIDRARIAVSPAIGERVVARAARWTLKNASGQAIHSVRLRPDGAADFGRELLLAPLAPGAETLLIRAAAVCRHTIALQLASGAEQTIRQDLCQKPEVRAPALRRPSAVTLAPGVVLSGPRQPAPSPPPAAVERPVPILRPTPVAPSAPRQQSRDGSIGALAGAGSGTATGSTQTLRPPRQRPAATAPPPAAAPAPVAPAQPAPAPPPPAAPAAGGAITDPVPEPIVEAAPTAPAEAVAWCPELEEEVPAIVCERLKQVERGTAGVSAPKTMIVGETRLVRLVVSRSADDAAVADALGGADAVSRAFTLSTGRYMEARLTGSSGLKFAPDDWVRRDLGAGDMEDWQWQVTALAAGRHQVVLQTRVMTRLADGSFVARDRRPGDPQFVDVTVTATQRFETGAGIVARWLAALTAPTESLTNLLTLLTTLLAAAAGLWAGIRAFGRKGSDDGD